LLTQVAGEPDAAPFRVASSCRRIVPAITVLVAAAAHDYASFAPEELENRRECGYPPFVRLVALRFEGPDLDRTGALAESLADRVRAASTASGVVLRGPAPGPLERLRDRYRWQLIVSASGTRALHEVVRTIQAAWRASSEARTIRLVVDVDPVSML
jgi:primosomal protein N' (replication factor Y)